MIEGYIELLGLFPYFHNFKLEQIEAEENWIKFTVSTTTEIIKTNNSKPILKIETEIHKKTTSFYITQETKIIKGENLLD